MAVGSLDRGLTLPEAAIPGIGVLHWWMIEQRLQAIHPVSKSKLVAMQALLTVNTIGWITGELGLAGAAVNHMETRNTAAVLGIYALARLGIATALVSMDAVGRRQLHR